MLSNQKEFESMQLQIKQKELQFDKSMSVGEEFSKTKILFNELKKMIARLDELNRNGEIRIKNHQ
ncbi:MAG TPA: hypothetical protein VGO21_06010 [Candidatus Paceibacterota bacterium]|jgi:hypothetical protein|nr:hypothetical protein [Candidatus Paceibacterota bacterium]